MSADNKYFSKFDGQTIDAAVETIQHLDTIVDSIIIESSPDHIYDLNELKDQPDGSYRISYYTNSANDSSSIRPIDVRVRHLNDITIEQRYEENPGVIYYRTYNTLDNAYTAWQKSDTLRVIQNGTVIGVREKSLIFRAVDDTEARKCTKYNGAQTVKVASEPT